jgi:DNA modification methylase
MINATMNIKMVPLHEIKPYENNVKQHPVKQLESIVQSIRQFGFRQPIVLDKNNVIVCGHARYEAAAALALSDVPCEMADDLTEEQINAYRILDNEIAAQGFTDKTMLSVELAKLPDFDFKPFNLDIPKIETIVEGLTDADDVPAITVNAKTKPGDVWLLGEHRLMCGDSTMIDSVERLMNGEKADMVFTDPPYGYKYESNHYKEGNPHGMLENDDSILDFIPLLNGFLKDNTAIYICGSHQTIHKWREIIDKEFDYKNLIVWKKNNWSMGDLKGSYAGQHELIIYAVKGKVNLRGERHRDIWEFNREPPKDHPTQKPVEMIEFAIKNTSDNGFTILDLFGGSGSTLIAAEKTNRKCLMMEISPAYCDVIVNRWQKFTGKEAILEGSDMKFNEVSNG